VWDKPPPPTHTLTHTRTHFPLCCHPPTSRQATACLLSMPLPLLASRLRSSTTGSTTGRCSSGPTDLCCIAIKFLYANRQFSFRGVPHRASDTVLDRPYVSAFLIVLLTQCWAPHTSLPSSSGELLARCCSCGWIPRPACRERKIQVSSCIDLDQLLHKEPTHRVPVLQFPFRIPEAPNRYKSVVV
jgi:hypothetical protein